MSEQKPASPGNHSRKASTNSQGFNKNRTLFCSPWQINGICEKKKIKGMRFWSTEMPRDLPDVRWMERHLTPKRWYGAELKGRKVMVKIKADFWQTQTHKLQAVFFLYRFNGSLTVGCVVVVFVGGVVTDMRFGKVDRVYYARRIKVMGVALPGRAWTGQKSSTWKTKEQ